MAQPRLAHAEQFAKHVARRPPPVKPAPAALALRWATSIFLLQASATGACTTRAHPPLAYALERIRRRPRSTSHGTQWPLPRLPSTSWTHSFTISPRRSFLVTQAIPSPDHSAADPHALQLTPGPRRIHTSPQSPPATGSRSRAPSFSFSLPSPLRGQARGWACSTLSLCVGVSLRLTFIPY